MPNYSLLKVSLISLSLFALSSLAGCSTSSAPHNQCVPPHPIEKGVSAPFAGFVGTRLVVGGGCNFPGVPAADGGKKVFYKEIYGCRLDADTLAWQKLGEFPQSVAYGASVETGSGLVCIGGVNEKAPMTEVYRIEANSQTGKVEMQSLPSLPQTIDNAAATCVGTTLYVTGGNQQDGGQSVYVLCMNKDSAWVKLTDYPGPKRIQPVLLASDESLYLFGGFSVKNETKEAIVFSDYLVYDIQKGKWSDPRSVPAMSDGTPRALVGSAGVRFGNKFFLAGGVNYAIFKTAVEGKSGADYMKHPAPWYKFSKEILAYDLLTKTWKVSVEVDGFNKAGGCLLQHHNDLYMVCGEEKPGIRTSKIIRVPLADIFNNK